MPDPVLDRFRCLTAFSVNRVTSGIVSRFYSLIQHRKLIKPKDLRQYPVTSIRTETKA